MTTDEMKAAIERLKQLQCDSLDEYDTVLALAEIGLLAVEAAIEGNKPSNGHDDEYKAMLDRTNEAANAFLAKHGLE